MTAARIDRALAAGRAATAGLAVAVALFLLFHVALVATFRAALVALAALEVMSFGWAALSRGADAPAWAVMGAKLAILGTAYLVLGG